MKTDKEIKEIIDEALKDTEMKDPEGLDIEEIKGFIPRVIKKSQERGLDESE